jgi:hypothetical protein
MPHAAAAASGVGYFCLPIHSDHTAPRLLVSLRRRGAVRKGCVMADREERPDDDQVRGIASNEDEEDFDSAEDLDEEDEDESGDEEGTF